MEYLALGVVFAIGLAAGLVIGLFIGIDRMRKAIEDQSVGYLRIDRSEPEEPPRPYLEAERGVTIDAISQMHVVVLKVVNESYLSHD